LKYGKIKGTYCKPFPRLYLNAGEVFAVTVTVKWFHDITHSQGISVPCWLVTARQPMTIINYIVVLIIISSLFVV